MLTSRPCAPFEYSEASIEDQIFGPSKPMRFCKDRSESAPQASVQWKVLVLPFVHRFVSKYVPTPQRALAFRTVQ